MASEAHTKAAELLLRIRDARGQQRDGAEITDFPLQTRNNLAWALRRQTPPIDQALRDEAQAALVALGAELGG
jgi:hypothetical protein